MPIPLWQAVALARDLLAELDVDAGDFTSVFGDDAAAALAPGAGLPRSVGLSTAAQAGVNGPILIVAPLGSQVSGLLCNPKQALNSPAP